MAAKKEKWIRAALVILVFAAMLLFFERAHPLVILDADDWTYISASRAAVPSRRFWNPARIFPELLMPYASNLAVLLFRPLGFVSSITVMNGLVLSLFITWYVLSFHTLLVRKLELREDASALLSLLFLLFHFLIFRLETSNNDYLFRARDVTCVYYYIIPGLLNCGLVMRLTATGEHRRFPDKDRPFRSGLLAVAAYLAIFSNLFGSVFLAAYCGLDFLYACFRRKKEDRRLFFRSQAFNLGVLLLWILSAFMEGGGERAESANTMPFLFSARLCLRSFLMQGRAMNHVFLLLTAAGLASGVFLAVRARKEERVGFPSLFLRCFLLFVLCAAFEILLCAKVRITYMMRSDALFVVYSAFLTLLTLSLAELVRKKEILIAGLPLLLIVVFSVTDTGMRTFMESNDLYAPAWVCTALDNDIIDQVLEAERAGKEEVTVCVIDSGSEDNWPQALYMGPRIAASLYEHGLTEKLMTIRLVRDMAVNERLHVMTGDAP